MKLAAIKHTDVIHWQTEKYNIKNSSKKYKKIKIKNKNKIQSYKTDTVAKCQITFHTLTNYPVSILRAVIRATHTEYRVHTLGCQWLRGQCQLLRVSTAASSAAQVKTRHLDMTSTSSCNLVLDLDLLLSSIHSTSYVSWTVVSYVVSARTVQRLAGQTSIRQTS